MILLINTTEQKKIWVGLADNSRVRSHRRLRTEFHESEKLLPLIDQLLRAADVSQNDLAGIGLATGAGSFTSVRVALVVANTLGWTLNIPVVTIPSDHASDREQFRRMAGRAIAVKTSFTPAAAEYSAPPTITRPNTTTP